MTEIIRATSAGIEGDLNDRWKDLFDVIECSNGTVRNAGGAVLAVLNEGDYSLIDPEDGHMPPHIAVESYQL